MKKVKLKKALPIILVAAGLFMANYPLVQSMGQSFGIGGGTETDAPPGSVDCWAYIIRDGSIGRRACTVTVNGILEKCKIVTDLSYYDALSTCVPVPPPQEE